VVQVLALDRRGALRPVSIQSDEGQRLLAGVPAQRRLATAHAVTADGRVFSGGDAAAPVAAALPAGAVLGPALRALGPVTRGAYGLVAGNRTRLGRLVTPAMRARADARLARP
jgi:predicted DCC family thiol-disulfide oxidoreductase YuxK